MVAIRAMADAKAGKFNRLQFSEAQEIARVRQMTELSDPFIYDRVLSNLVNGICDGVDWAPGKRP